MKLFLDLGSSPVLISIESTDYPVDNLPFPAVTICRKDADPNRFFLTARILDHIKFPCYVTYVAYGRIGIGFRAWVRVGVSHWCWFWLWVSASVCNQEGTWTLQVQVVSPNEWNFLVQWLWLSW